MALWMVRAGRNGEFEDFVLDEGVVAVGWPRLPDLVEAKSRDAILLLLQQAYPDMKPGTLRNWRNQLWAVRSRIKAEDLVALPFKTRSAVAIGRITGSYQYHAEFPEGARHTRPVQWLQKDIPRSAFGQDLLYSLGASQTVCQIQRNDAEKRVKTMLEGNPDPLLQSDTGEEGSEGPVVPVDLDAYSRDLIRSFVGRKFSGHDMERLVAAILQAQGYRAQSAPIGADGGVDIVAGRGPMGFETPRLCVQIKSSDQPQDVTVLRELQGVLQSFGAEHGLLISWGGFRSSVIAEARRLFFNIRLWDADDLVEAILGNYEQLPEDVRAELPLKRIWTLVLEEE